MSTRTNTELIRELTDDVRVVQGERVGDRRDIDKLLQGMANVSSRLSALEATVEVSVRAIEQRIQSTERALEQRMEASDKLHQQRIEALERSLERRIEASDKLHQQRMEALEKRMELLENRLDTIEKRQWQFLLGMFVLFVTALVNIGVSVMLSRLGQGG